MKTLRKRITLIMLVVCMVITIFTVIQSSAATSITEEEFASKIAQLKNEYPHGKYWNNYNGTETIGGYTTSKVGDSICPGSSCRSNGYCAGDCSCSCGRFVGGQCFGFANLMAYKVFGSYATTNYYSNGVNTAKGWKYYTSVSKYYAGDVVRISNSHSIFIVKVSDDTVSYVDCNSSGPCKIDWNKSMSVSMLISKTTFVVHMDGNTLTGNSSIEDDTTDSSINLTHFNSKLNQFKKEEYAHNSIYVDDPANTGGYECFGFANELAKYIFGSYPTNSMSAATVNSKWQVTYGGNAVDNLSIGDIVRYGYHSIFITGINGDTIYYCQANVPYGTNKVTYDNSMSRSSLKSKVSQLLSSGGGKTGWVAHFKDSQVVVSNILIVHYNSNGGYIPNSETITVTESVGIRLRSGAGTSYDSLAIIPQNTILTVTDIKTDSDYVWGRVNYNGTDGWCVISEGWTSRETDFCLDSNNMLYYSSSYSYINSKISVGIPHQTGLYNASTLNLQREGYTFVGWSLSASGGTILDENIEYKAEDIYPDTVNGNQTVTVYAQWEPNCTNHNWITDTVYTAATCTTAGSGRNICSICGETQDVTIPALGHNTTSHAGKSATCTEKGWNSYVTCSRCNYTTYSEISVLGHNTTIHSGMSPTCTEKGWTSYVTCSRCDYTTYKEIPAAGHYATGKNCGICGILLNGFVNESGGTRYYSNGIYAKGWTIIDGKTYRFDGQGILFEGSSMVYGSQTYYFSSEHAILEGLVLDSDGYRFYKGGVRQYAWQDTNGDGVKDSYFYSTTFLRCETDRQLFDGKDTRRFYTYNADTGFMEALTGFYTDENGTKFYKNGLQKYGWITPEGEIINDRQGVEVAGAYYFAFGDGKNFYRVEDSTKTIGGVVREFDENHLVKAYTGWNINKKTLGMNYYINGVLQQGWVETSDGWMYFSRSENLGNGITYGDVFHGWRKIGGKVYYFRSGASTPAYVIISDSERELTYKGVRSTYYINQVPANGSTLVGSDFYIINPPVGL